MNETKVYPPQKWLNAHKGHDKKTIYKPFQDEMTVWIHCKECSKLYLLDKYKEE